MFVIVSVVAIAMLHNGTYRTFVMMVRYKWQRQQYNCCQSHNSYVELLLHYIFNLAAKVANKHCNRVAKLYVCHFFDARTILKSV